ncbi:hypothetical protein GCM10028784_14750 [Myceligenerans cantabricum]
MKSEQEAAGAAMRQFVEDMGLVLESAGLPRAAGRILGHLLACDPPGQQAQQIEEALEASSGSVSTNLRMLVQLGFVEKIAVPGDRRAHYRVGPEAWDAVISDQLRVSGALRRVAEKGLEVLSGAPEEDRRRLQDTVDFFTFLEKHLPELIHRYHDERA